MSASARFANRLRDLSFLPGLGGRWQRRLEGRVLCLLYHRVDVPGRDPFLDRFGPPVIAPAELERDLRFWKARGARFATFRDLREGWFPVESEVCVIVCFDDGFRDNYEQGLEVLAHVGIPATIFQVTALVGARELLWEHALYLRCLDAANGASFRRAALDRLEAPAGIDPRDAALAIDWLRFEAPRRDLAEVLTEARDAAGESAREADLAARLYPSTEDLRRAARLGHEIGSHGHSHQPRNGLSDAELDADLQRASERLADWLGEPPGAYSFPFGRFRPGDEGITARYHAQAAIVEPRPIDRATPFQRLPRCTWPGTARNGLRRRRWLLTGRI